MAVHRNLRFGPFELSSRERVLRREGVVMPLGSRALDLLIYLAERPGEVIAKQELIDHVWPDATVEEGSLRVHVAAIRRALGDGQFGNRYIANVKGRGYSFVGTIVPLAGSTESRNDKFRYQGRLPVRPIMMIGRETVVSEVGDKLRNERFVTLLGPGGIGKTTIALAVGRAIAEEFGGNVHFVDLESLTDPRHVAGAVATSLGLSLKSKDPCLELVDLVRSRKLLIILDSCEHVIEAVASLAEQLYRQTEEIHVLTPSRELLKVEGEHCYRVLPLDFPPDGSEQTANAVLRQTTAPESSFAANQQIHLVANSVAKLVETARRELERDREAAKASLVTASRILQAEIERYSGANGSTTGSLAAWQMLRVRAYIDSNLHRTIHIRDLSAVAGLSPAHFSRKFKLAVGESPHAYVVSRRLERACHLMITSSESLSEIALSAGFSDHAHLCRLFRQAFGQSLANWRREREIPGEVTSRTGMDENIP
jgi:DNA-binding winged helix-turn-helix (wHTH) protein/AraC-like DNA-binding protein